MAIRYAVDLIDTERAALREMISKNKAKRSTIMKPIFYSRPIEPVVGQTLTLLRRMQCPPKKSSSSRNVLWKKDLQRPCIVKR
jgi:hypothetical protein